MSLINLQNLLHDVGLDYFAALTFSGVEYEFEWYEPAVAPGGKVYLKVTSPTDKYTLVGFREIRHDQTRGWFRQYRIFSGGTVARTIPLVNMRGDSTVASAATIQVVTAPTVNVANAFSAIPLWGAGTLGGRPQGGGLESDSAFRIIPPGAVVLLEFENNSIEPAAWYAYFKQHEVSRHAVPKVKEV